MLYPTVLSTAGACFQILDCTTCWAYLKSDLSKDFFNFGIVLFFLYGNPISHSLLKIIARLLTDSSAETFYDPAHYSLIGIVWLYPGIEPAR